MYIKRNPAQLSAGVGVKRHSETVYKKGCTYLGQILLLVEHVADRAAETQLVVGQRVLARQDQRDGDREVSLAVSHLIVFEPNAPVVRVVADLPVESGHGPQLAVLLDLHTELPSQVSDLLEIGMRLTEHDTISVGLRARSSLLLVRIRCGHAMPTFPETLEIKERV